jgi:hypothetical protein
MISGSKSLHKIILAISLTIYLIVLALDNDGNDLITVDPGVSVSKCCAYVLDIAA